MKLSAYLGNQQLQSCAKEAAGMMAFEGKRDDEVRSRAIQSSAPTTILWL